MRGRALWIAGVVAAGIGLIGACRSPTQMTITVRYGASFGGCASFTKAQIYVGSDPTSLETSKIPGGFTVAEATTCNDALVGTLVITPNDGDQAAVAIVSGVGVDPRTCKPPLYTGGCIVARRAFSFISHTRLELPIDLDLDCKDVPCTANTTCRRGSCISSDVSCTDDGTCVLSVDTPGGGGEAGIDSTAPDGTSAIDGSPDDSGRLEGGADGGSLEGGSPDGGFVSACTSGFADAGRCSAGDVCCFGDMSGIACGEQGTCDWQIRRCIGRVDCPQGSTCCAKLDMVTGASGHDKWQSFCRATSCSPGETEMCTGAPGDCGGDPMCLSFASAMPGMRYCP